MEPVKCPFCKPFASDIVAKNEFCYAFWGRFPASKGQPLNMPFRHTLNIFTLNAEECLILFNLIDDCRVVIEEIFIRSRTISGSIRAKRPARP
jgi:diadenosine tetraphosphate (Ap4A) HIT family hydrolase